MFARTSYKIRFMFSDSSTMKKCVCYGCDDVIVFVVITIV